MPPAARPAPPLFAVLIVLLLLPPAAAAGDQRLFWKVESPQGTAWLLGSLHFGDPSMYPLPSMITDALLSSELLVVEVDITAQPLESIAEQINARGLYQGDRRLPQVVGTDTWGALAEVATELGLPVPLLERQKPWFASMTLTTLALARQGYRSDLGIDLHLMNLAAGEIPIVELESIGQQVELLDSLSEEGQIQMLEQTLDQIDDAGHYFQVMLEVWQNGDAPRLDEILLEEYQWDDGTDEIYQSLIVGRNAAMRREIGRLLQEYEVIFVVVGAGHMVGEDGIVARLEADGYQVSQPGR